MRDDQITDLLRSLEADRVPDPDFADNLYVALVAGASAPRSRRWPVFLLAAAAALAIGGGAALGAGLLDPPATAEPTILPSPFPTAGSTATPLPSLAPSISAAPSISPQPSRTATAEPTSAPNARPQDVLPPGALVVVEVEGVRIRQGASTTAAPIATAARGEILYLDDSHAGPGATIPPVHADGLDWYSVMYATGHRDWPALPASEDIVRGWIARGPPSAPFVELVPPQCSDLADLATLVTLTAYERVACLGDQPLTIAGTFGCPHCDSLSFTGVWEPRWLAEYFTVRNMLAPAWDGYSATGTWPSFISLAWPPEQPEPEGDMRGSILRITGHFADARAGDCVIVGEQVASHPEAADWYCQTLFVVETWEIIGIDPDFERDPF